MPEVTGDLVLRRVEVDGAVVDVRVEGGRIAAIGPALSRRVGVPEVDGAGGALLPGLHDHHLHLLALAAARRSVRLGSGRVADRDAMAAALRDAAAELEAGEWLRAVGYHESIAGDLDRHDLDQMVPDRPLRLQHRSGARWLLNSAALRVLGAEAARRPELERDDAGELTGRIHRGDSWLRDVLPEGDPPPLAEVGARLASLGVTGVTDATPFDRMSALEPIQRAAAAGELPLEVVVMGGVELAAADFGPGLIPGPVKYVIDDAVYPSLEEVCDAIATAHRYHRPIAIHSVTRTSLVLALAAWDVVGSRAGDRIEHGSVIPTELYGSLLRHRLVVVTQPGFVVERGEDYLRDVDADDQPHLYPCRSLLEDGIPVGCSTDAPYTDEDPWRAIAAATTRRTSRGSVLGPGETVSAERALEMFLTPADTPGGAPRRIAVGEPADLCLLHVPRAVALDAPSAVHVRSTFVEGVETPR